MAQSAATLSKIQPWYPKSKSMKTIFMPGYLQLKNGSSRILLAMISFMTLLGACGGKNEASPMVDTPAAATGYGAIMPVKSMNAARAAHTATLLEDGSVLICGGFAGSAVASAEIYAPLSKTFRQMGAMSVPRSGHTATLLPDGRVLIAGGYNGYYLQSTEIFDPTTQTFSAGPEMTAARSEHTATTLSNGKILLAGGVGTDWTFLQSAEVYDPDSATFSPTGFLTAPRESHTATLLQDGTVLITGGHKDRRENIKIYSTAEIYDPATGKFRLTGEMATRRHKHDALLLADGRVLINGGSDERDGDGAYTSTEIYNPETSVFGTAPPMSLSRYKHNRTSVLLANNDILIAGGTNSAEIFDHKAGTFSIVRGNMSTKRLFSCATRLANGQVLITGGYDENGKTGKEAWIFTSEK